MFVSFGPQPDQYRAYAGAERNQLPPGTTGPVTDVVTFYDETRGKTFRATFSLLSALGPLAAFAVTVWLLASMLSGEGGASPLVDGGEIPPLPIDAFCGSPEAHGALLNAAFAQTVRF